MAKRGRRGVGAPDLVGVATWAWTLWRAVEAGPWDWARPGVRLGWVGRRVPVPAREILQGLGWFLPGWLTQMGKLRADVVDLGRRLRGLAESQRRQGHTLAALAGRLDLLDRRLHDLGEAVAASGGQTERLRALERRLEILAASASPRAVTQEQVEEIWDALSGLTKLFEGLNAAAAPEAGRPDLAPRDRS